MTLQDKSFPIKILMDTSILHHANAIKPMWVTNHFSVLGKIPIESGYLDSTEKGQPISNRKGGEQTRYLAALRDMFLSNKLEAYTTDALLFESLHNNMGGFSCGGASLLQGIEYKKIRTLTHFTVIIPNDDILDSLRQYLKNANEPEFVSIRDALRRVAGEKTSQDAWHLFCAIRYKFDFFLTCDMTLISQIKSISEKRLRECFLGIVKSPRELCDLLAISPMSDFEMKNLLPRLSGLSSRTNEC